MITIMTSKTMDHRNTHWALCWGRHTSKSLEGRFVVQKFSHLNIYIYTPHDNQLSGQTKLLTSMENRKFTSIHWTCTIKYKTFKNKASNRSSACRLRIQETKGNQPPIWFPAANQPTTANTNKITKANHQPFWLLRKQRNKKWQTKKSLCLYLL